MPATPTTLTTTRLRLTPLTPDDADEMLGVFGDVAMYEFTGGAPPTLDQLRARYRRLAVGHSDDHRQRWHNWVVRLADDGCGVGVVQATVTADGSSADVAWEIGVVWQGRGIASEASAAMVSWLAGQGVTTISASVHPDHHASAAVAARAGMTATDETNDGEIVWRYSAPRRRLIDLSHRIVDGMVTYPGLPTPVIGTHLSREEAAEIYASGTTFHIGQIDICTNTGTYLDVPFHRFAEGHDLAALPLERVAGVPGVALDRRGQTTIDLTPEELAGLTGHAVLVRTDHSVHFGTDVYAADHPHLSAAAAEALVDAGVACVGIDSLNIDATSDGTRPVHTILLGAEIPIVEHLTNLAAVPARGFRFTAVPPRFEGAGTFTVRAFAALD